MSSSIRLPAVETRLAVPLCRPNWLADAAVKSSKCAVVPVVMRAVPAEQCQQVGRASQGDWIHATGRTQSDTQALHCEQMHKLQHNQP
jgi:hypothetical protein